VVSSQVQNPAIKPEHLVDGDLQTAWNSRTGDLVGAWIEVRLPPQAAARELRITAGHTGRGPKGEDYFTMNPRIKRIGLRSGKTALAARDLDITNRGLQRIELGALPAGETLRIEVQAIEPGTKKSWRETCVSELEVWGAAPAAIQHASVRPKIAVDPAIAASALCDEYTAADDAYNRETKRQEKSPTCPTCVDGPSDLRGYAGCSVQLAAFAPTPPWQAVAVRCHVTNSHHEDKECTFAMLTDTWWLGPSEALLPIRPLEIVDVKATTRDLVVHYRIGDATKTLACTAAGDCKVSGSVP
jgi:hypothetical protein